MPKSLLAYEGQGCKSKAHGPHPGTPAQKIGLQWMSELNYSPPQLKKEDSLKTIRQEMSTEISAVARN